MFVNYVADTFPEDLNVFARYIDTALSSGFYEESVVSEKFGSILPLIHTFALHDQLQDGAACFKFMAVVSERLLKKQTKQDGMNRDLVHVIWTLLYRDQRTYSKTTNPIIPRLLEKLYSYKREAALSRVELLELFQIKIWVDQEVKKGLLPEVFAKCIPAEIAEEAEQRFAEYDRQTYSQVQSEIAECLLDLRVTFKENQRLN